MMWAQSCVMTLENSHTCTKFFFKLNETQCAFDINRLIRFGNILRGCPQIVEAKEAGAAGILGIISSVSGAGAPVLSSFTAALGLDSPVEVSPS